MSLVSVSALFVSATTQQAQPQDKQSCNACTAKQFDALLAKITGRSAGVEDNESLEQAKGIVPADLDQAQGGSGLDQFMQQLFAALQILQETSEKDHPYHHPLEEAQQAKPAPAAPADNTAIAASVIAI